LLIPYPTTLKKMQILPATLGLLAAIASTASAQSLDYEYGTAPVSLVKTEDVRNLVSYSRAGTYVDAYIDVLVAVKNLAYDKVCT
jgi:hypothetical protein